MYILYGLTFLVIQFSANTVNIFLFICSSYHTQLATHFSPSPPLPCIVNPLIAADRHTLQLINCCFNKSNQPHASAVCVQKFLTLILLFYFRLLHHVFTIVFGHINHLITQPQGSECRAVLLKTLSTFSNSSE